MTELTRQIKRASMSHSLMNGYSLLLPRLAEENDERIKRLERENNYLREEFAESRRANEHLYTELRRCKQILHARESIAILKLLEENAKLREYTNELLRVVKLGEIDCGACRHFDECYAGDAMDFAPENCRLVVYAREFGIEVS